MKRKTKRRKQIPTRTLGNLNVRKKVEVKPHIRKNRNGKRVVVKAYERSVGGSKDSISKSVDTKAKSGSEFEKLKNRLTPYGAKAKEGIKTFQANAGDLISQYKDKLSQQVKDKYNKSRKNLSKRLEQDDKPWTDFDVKMAMFMGKRGVKYKKYF